MAVPCHIPLPIVPSVVMLACPTYAASISIFPLTLIRLLVPIASIVEPVLVNPSPAKISAALLNWVQLMAVVPMVIVPSVVIT